MATAVSPLGNVQWIFAGSYTEEINREVKWYSSWANHYYEQGGMGVVFAAVQIIPIALLLCPAVNIVTYLVLSTLFQGKEGTLFQTAMDQDNATGAYIQSERGANPAQKNGEGKTLLDLYAAKGVKLKGFSTQDLDIIESLFKKDVPADFSHKGFKLLLDTAILKKRHELVVFLVQKDVEPLLSWEQYRPKLTVETLPLPDWAKNSIAALKDGENLCKLATKETLQKFSQKGDPVYQTMRVFGQSMRNCPILLGESEVERKSLMTTLTREILKDSVPENLKQKQVIGIDLALIDGKTNMQDVRNLLITYSITLKNNPNLIFYIHNFEIFEKATTAHPEIKKALADLASTGRVVFSMTSAIYKRHLSQDHVMQKGFTTIEVSTPSEKEAIPLLHVMKQELEAQHCVTYTSSAIEAAIDMMHYIPGAKIPQTSYEVLDAAASLFKEQETKGSIEAQEAEKKKRELLFDQKIYRLKNGAASKKRLDRIEEELKEVEETLKALKKQDTKELEDKKAYQELRAKKIYFESIEVKAQPLLDKVEKDLSSYESLKESSHIKFEVDRELVAAVVSARAGIPLNRVRGAEAEKLRKLDKTLSEQVIGQPRAVEAISKTLKTARLGIRNASKPRGVFLCAGTSGTGKTEMAKAIARNLFGDERNMTRLDMSEYQQKENKSRLIGAPPGYVGYDKGGQLTEALKQNPYQVILIDEVEKAAPDVLTAFLQVFSDGRLTDGQGNVVDCTQAVFLMTTNLGSRAIAVNHTPAKWFHFRHHFNGYFYGHPTDEAIIQQALQNSEHFSPELIGRLKIVTFDPVTNRSDLQKIVRKVLKQHQGEILKTEGIELNWSEKVVEVLASQGGSIAYGVRPLIDLIEDVVLNTLSQMMLDDKIREGDTVKLEYEEATSQFSFKRVSA